MPQPSLCTHYNSELDDTIQDNVVIGDVSEGFSRMLAPGGVDKELLIITDGIEVPKYTFMYTDNDKAILRQYGGAMMLSYEYSIFHRRRELLSITIYLIFVIQCRIWN